MAAALTPDLAAEVAAACRAGADEIVSALTRALDGQFVGVTVNDAIVYDASQPPPGFAGGGLAVVFQTAGGSAVAILPETSGLLPKWYRQPDATGKSKLSTLAQELSMLLLPAAIAADEYHVVPVTALSATLAKAELTPTAALVPLELQQAERKGQLSLIWPIAKPAEFLPKAVMPPVAPRITEPVGPPPLDDGGDDLSNLPRHTRSFLKVEVPVSVNLAAQKLKLQEIRELVPGAIIKFDKSCDELLDLVVCDQPIAAGEVVKVGDKFGLRIRNMILPQEQFIAIKTTMTV